MDAQGRGRRPRSLSGRKRGKAEAPCPLFHRGFPTSPSLPGSQPRGLGDSQVSRPGRVGQRPGVGDSRMDIFPVWAQHSVLRVFTWLQKKKCVSLPELSGMNLELSAANLESGKGAGRERRQPRSGGIDSPGHHVSLGFGLPSHRRLGATNFLFSSSTFSSGNENSPGSHSHEHQALSCTVGFVSHLLKHRSH